MSSTRWWGDAPFVVIPKWWIERGLRGSNMVVAVAIVGHADNETGMWTPAVSLLVRETGLSRRSVQYALGWLELQGFITRNPRRRRASEITVHPISIGPEMRFEIIDDAVQDPSEAHKPATDRPQLTPDEARERILGIVDKPTVPRGRMSGPRKVRELLPAAEPI